MQISSGVLLARMVARSRLRQWQLVEQIAALGTVQGAADAVGMSQPAATHALAELEKLLDFPLFERHAKGARLTLAGEAVLPRVRIAMKAFAECAEVVSDLLSGSAGELRVGAIGASLGSVLGDAMAEFSSSHAALAIHVEQMEPERLLHALRDGMIDLAVARSPQQLPAGMLFEPLLPDRYVVVCSQRHPLAGRSGVALAEMAQQLWQMPPKSTIAERDFLAMWVGGEAPRQLCWVESRAMQLLWAMAERRGALALIPYNTARPWLLSGALAEVPGTWGPPLQPLGLLVQVAALGMRGPVAEFVDTLRRLALAASAAPAASAASAAPADAAAPPASADA